LRPTVDPLRVGQLADAFDGKCCAPFFPGFFFSSPRCFFRRQGLSPLNLIAKVPAPRLLFARVSDKELPCSSFALALFLLFFPASGFPPPPPRFKRTPRSLFCRLLCFISDGRSDFTRESFAHVPEPPLCSAIWPIFQRTLSSCYYLSDQALPVLEVREFFGLGREGSQSPSLFSPASLSFSDHSRACNPF